MKHYLERVHRGPVACEVAGVNEVTLRSWRRRHGFLKGDVPGREWPQFSLLQICQIRLAGLATDHGVNPVNAIQFAELLEKPLSGTLDGWDAYRIVGFTKPGGNLWQHRVADRLDLVEPAPGKLLKDALEGSDEAMVTFVDLGKVVKEVRARLELVLKGKLQPGAQWQYKTIKGDS
jgi:hypothetical protein